LREHFRFNGAHRPDSRHVVKPAATESRDLGDVRSNVALAAPRDTLVASDGSPSHGRFTP